MKVFGYLVIYLTVLGCSQKERLTADQIGSISNERLEEFIFDNLYETIQYSGLNEKDAVAVLSKGQKAIYVTWILEGEVNNGGFNQFYFNSSGQLADFAEDAFITVGAHKLADLVREANLTYDLVKNDLEKYNDGTLESFSKSYEGNPLNDLDDKFYELAEVEPLSNLRIKYIRSNIEEFSK